MVEHLPSKFEPLNINRNNTTTKNPGQHQWLTPVILATQEAEIKRIMI
jgi:hypothetical protein